MHLAMGSKRTDSGDRKKRTCIFCVPSNAEIFVNATGLQAEWSFTWFSQWRLPEFKRSEKLPAGATQQSGNAIRGHNTLNKTRQNALMKNVKDIDERLGSWAKFAHPSRPSKPSTGRTIHWGSGCAEISLVPFPLAETIEASVSGGEMDEIVRAPFRLGRLTITQDQQAGRQ